ncbi:uncharacterized, partial [Tachysurus ichikawai]
CPPSPSPDEGPVKEKMKIFPPQSCSEKGLTGLKPTNDLQRRKQSMWLKATEQRTRSRRRSFIIGQTGCVQNIHKTYHESTKVQREGRSEGRSKGRSEGRSEGQGEGRSDGRSEVQSEGRSEGRSERRNEGRSEVQSEGWSQGKSEGRSEGRNEVQSEGKSELQSEGSGEEDFLVPQTPAHGSRQTTMQK